MAGNQANRELLLKNVRFSYLYCFEPFTNADGKKTFKSHFLLPKDHPQMGELMQAVKDVARDFWGDKADSALEWIKANNKLCVRKGETQDDENYKGLIFVAGNAKNRFTVVETRGGVNVELTASDVRPRSGDYGNAKIAIYAMQHTTGGKMINCQILGIQYVRKGAPLGGGGRVASVDEFGVEPSDADGEAPATAISGGDVDDLLG